MKAPIFIPVLSASIVVILLLSILSFFFLPFVLPLGMDVVREELLEPQGKREVFDFTALKAACTFPLYHPFYQSIRYSFMQPIINTSSLKLMIEVFPEGALGDSQQVLKGVSTGSIEMTLIAVDDMGDAIDMPLLLSDVQPPGGSLLNRRLSTYMDGNAVVIDPEQIQVIGLVEGAMRTLWKVNTDAADKSRIAALSTPTRRFDSYLEDLGYTPVWIPKEALSLGALDGRYRLIELDFVDRYYLDWTGAISLEQSGAPEIPRYYLLLINRDIWEKLRQNQKSLLLNTAGHFIYDSRLLVRQAEAEIRSHILN